jgi:uncharacterized protein DUF4349
MHDRMESIADLYAAGGLSPNEKRDAEAHAESCKACAALLREAADFHRWVSGTIAPDAPPADLEDRIVAHLRTSAALKTRRWRFLAGKRLWKLVGGVAAAVGMVFLGNVFSQASAGLRNLETATADFRGTDRDGEKIHDFYIEDHYGKSKGWDGYLSMGGKGGGGPLNLNSATIDQVNRANWGYQAEQAQRRLGFSGVVDRDWGRIDSPEKVATASEEVKKLEDLSKSATLAVEKEADKKDKPVSDDAIEKTLKLAEAGSESKDAMPRKSLTGATFTADEPAANTGKVFIPEKEPAPTPVQENRKIIRNADVDLEVESYDATLTKLEELVKAEKGFVATSSTHKLANGKISAVLTVRVPPEQFEPLLAKLRTLGTVRNQNVGSQDITKAYVDLETRRASKEALLERLKLLLKEAKGTVKELLEVEVQMGKTIEEIESIKGELKYYDNLVGLSTITLTISEKDLGQPFEYVQTLQANIGLTALNADDAYTKAQKEIIDAGGQVVDSKMTRQNDGSATGTIKARVEAEKFPALREALKKLGHVTNDTVNQRKSARGGAEGTPKADAPLKKEQAVIDLSITTPPLVVTRRAALLVEHDKVQSVYQDARKTIEAMGGKVVNGSLTGRDGGTAATLVAQIDADKFAALVDQLKQTGKVKNAAVKHDLPAATPDGAPLLLRERAEIEYTLVSPPELIGEDQGIGKKIRDTFAGSWAGVLWSIEKLFVGLSLAGPWIGLLAIAWIVWRRLRKKKPAPSV